jgi:hypothetical protein
MRLSLLFIMNHQHNYLNLTIIHLLPHAIRTLSSLATKVRVYTSHSMLGFQEQYEADNNKTEFSSWNISQMLPN